MPPEPLAVLRRAARAVADVLAHHSDWSLTGAGHNQYHHDVAADAAVVEVLGGAGYGVFSEESGWHHPEREITVVVDPVDGSTNASKGIPWWATSLCALDSDGPVAAVVVNHPTSEWFEAVRGGGATRNGDPIAPAQVERLPDSVVVFNGYPERNYGWAQYRALGAAALDLCAVAWGCVDGFVDASPGGLAPWDYLGGLLVCQEAGAVVGEVWDRELVVRRPGERRVLVAGGTRALFDALLAARRGGAGN